MYLIVGLGNPEEDYSNTRHNMGFDTINKIANQYEISVTRKKFKGLYGIGDIEGERAILLKPQTFMNLSGESIIEAINFYKIDKEKIIIIYDDIDTPKGTIKLRKTGGPGTHNGMKSVVQCIKTRDFARVKVGIGKPDEDENLIEYVIGEVSDEDLQVLDSATTLAKDAVIEIIKNGIDNAMNKMN